MTDRYKKFAAMQVRNIKGYNDVVVKKNKDGIDPPMEKLPQIVIIIDELADLMMVAPVRSKMQYAVWLSLLERPEYIWL